MEKRKTADKKFFITAGVLLAAEVLLLSLCVWGILRGDETVLEHVQPEDTCSLAAGIYDVWYEYEVKESSVNALTLLDERGWEMGKRANLTMLHAGVEKVRTRLWLFRSTETLYVHLDQIGQPELTIRNITFVRTNRGSWIALLAVGIVSLALDLYLAGKCRDRRGQSGTGKIRPGQKGISPTQKGIVAALALAVLLATAPALMAQTILGHDAAFHTLRLEGLVCGWQDGYFPVRIQPGWVFGNGYAVSIYYNDLFLAVPAALMWLGFTLTGAYAVYILLVNVATVWIAYVCFRRWFQSAGAAAVGSMAYLLFPYRLYDIYGRMAVGEYTALTFLPLIAYGLYRILAEAPGETSGKNPQGDYRQSWLPLCLGLSGVISSHVLTGVMVAFAMLCLFLVMIRKVLKRKALQMLVKAAVFTVLLNLWYLLPFVDYFLSEEIYMSGEGWKELQYHMVYETALSPAQLLQTFYGREEAKGLGFVLTGALLAYGGLWFTGVAGRQEKAERTTGKVTAVFAACFAGMATVYFPWKELQEAGGVMEYLVQSIQFPYRWLGPAACLCGVLLCAVCSAVEKERLVPNRLLLFGVTCGMIFLPAGYQIGKIIDESPAAGYYSGDVLGKNGLGTREYLPIEANFDMISFRWPEASPNVTVEAQEKETDSLRVQVSCSNLSGQAGYVDVPLLHYKGYVAEDLETGERLEVVNNGTGSVRVIVPQGYRGRLEVRFREPWYWRAAELVSLATLAVLPVMACRRKKYVSARKAGKG